MTGHILRNTVSLLLVLTLANLAASFAALRAVRAARADAEVHLRTVDAAIVQLSAVTATLCRQHGDACVTLVAATNPSRTK